MTAWVLMTALLGGSERGADPCDLRCANVVKVCGQQCEKQFPRAQADSCKKACTGSASACKEQCKKPPEEK